LRIPLLSDQVVKLHPREGRPHKLDVFENSVFFTTFQNNRVFKVGCITLMLDYKNVDNDLSFLLPKVDKFGRAKGSSGGLTKIVEEVTLVADLAIMQEMKQDRSIANPCGGGGIADCDAVGTICLLKSAGGGNGAKNCFCRDGYKRQPDGQCLEMEVRQLPFCLCGRVTYQRMSNENIRCLNTL
jgi:hypothetical protein